MGHERVGVLPRSVRWREVVGKISGSVGSSEAAIALSDATIENVRRRFARLADDSELQASFAFLLALLAAGRSNNPSAALGSLVGVGFEGEATPIQLLKLFRASRSGSSPSEIGDLSTRALADALVSFADDAEHSQVHLFGTNSWDLWRQADSGSAFCELARCYFARLTERYVRYFLDREASSVVGGPAELEQFRAQLTASLDSISQHAFETSKITQSFAAGWFNKHARQKEPGPRQVRAFLVHALNKIREELRREAGH